MASIATISLPEDLMKEVKKIQDRDKRGSLSNTVQWLIIQGLEAERQQARKDQNAQ